MNLSPAEARKLGLLRTREDKQKHMAKRSALISERKQGRDKLFDAACEAHGLPLPVHEYPFAQDIGRKWRLDFIFEGWLALEVQGGLFTGGRHVRGAALLEEYEKLNEATIRGFALVFATPDQVQDGSVFPLLVRALAARAEQP